MNAAPRSVNGAWTVTAPVTWMLRPSEKTASGRYSVSNRSGSGTSLFRSASRWVMAMSASSIASAAKPAKSRAETMRCSEARQTVIASTQDRYSRRR